MTNEEAITRLKGLYGNDYKEQEQALDMAIRALKNEQTDGDLISRTDLLKDIADLKKSPWFNDGKDIKDLFRHNSYVARKEAVEIIEDLCIKNMQSAEKTTLRNFTQQKATDGDLISRQSVITMLNKIENAVEDGDGFQFNEWIDYAKDIPSAEKTAEWIIYPDSIQCSNCKTFYQKIRIDQKHYCQNCGAKMKGYKE